jgi:hypothetical protein
LETSDKKHTNTNTGKVMKHKFDELTKDLAQSVTRRAALKQFGARLAGMTLACLGLAGSAYASGCRGTGVLCRTILACRASHPAGLFSGTSAVLTGHAQAACPAVMARPFDLPRIHLKLGY